MELVDRTRTLDLASSTSPNAGQLCTQLAALAALVEPAFATSTAWAGGVTMAESVGPPDDRSFLRQERYADGPFAIEVAQQDWQGGSQTSARAIGLPNEGRIELVVDETWMGKPSEHRRELRLFVRLPAPLADAVLARFG